ncbi:MAG TPA: hypothetical protein VFH22_12175, partial [Rhodocyclaceae bacterium]|nr:hypothetical protein [Rhodocyclaceae bacterium]
MPAPLPTFGFAEQPARRAWSGLALALLGLAVLPPGALLLAPGAAHHALILHAGVAGVLLPLCLLGRLDTGVPSWRGRLLWLSLAGAAGGLLALVLAGAGQPLLLSFFPLLRGTPQAALLIAPPVVAVVALLLRPRGPDPHGLAWLALPLVVALTTLAWGWTASADVAPHVREELVAWGSGHAWLLVLASLSLCGWLQLAEVSGPSAVSWSRRFALTAAGLLLAPAGLPIDSTEYLRTINQLALALCGLVPAGLAVALLRDPVRRAVGGAWLIAAIAIYFAALLAAAWLLFAAAASPAASRGGALLLQHGLGLAAIVALWGAQRRSPDRTPRPLAAPAPTGAVGAWRLAAVLIAGGPILALALDPPQRAPLDPASRQHALDRRQQEIAERFRQGV